MRKITYFICLIFCLSVELIAQTDKQNIDNLIKKAEQNYYKNQYEESLKIYEQIESIYQKNKQFHQQAALKVDIASIYNAQGNFHEIFKMIDKGVLLLKKYPQNSIDTTLFRLLYAKANTFYRIYSFDSSTYYYEKANKLLTNNPSIEKLPAAFLFYKNQGALLGLVNDFDQSNLQYGKAEKLLNSSNQEKKALLLDYQGRNYLSQNLYAKSIAYFKSAIQASTLSSEKYWFYSDLAKAYKANQNIEGAFKAVNESEKLYKQARRQYPEYQDFEYEEYIDLLKGRLWIDKGDYSKAATFLNKSLVVQKKIFAPKNEDTHTVFLSFGEISEKQHNLKQALAYYQQALIAIHRGFERQDIYQNPSLTGAVSDISLFDGLYAKAKAFGLYYAQTHQLKDLQMALSTFQLAIQLAEKTRISYESAGSKLYFIEKNYAVYGQALAVAHQLWQLTKRPEYQAVAFNIMERSRAAILADARKNMDIKPKTIPANLLAKEKMLNRAVTGWKISLAATQDSTQSMALKNNILTNELALMQLRQSYEKISPQYFQLKYQSQNLTLSEAQQQLSDPQTALISYFLADNTLYMSLVTTESTQLLKQTLDSTFSKDLQALRKQLYKNPGMSTYDHHPAERCYAHLILPLERWLANKTRLIIIRDGALNFIPFEILESGQIAKDFLVKRFAISYTYSAHLLAESKATEPTGSKHLMAMAPYTNQAAVRSLFRDKTLKTLPATENEVRQIGGDIYLERQATKRRFLETYQKNGVIHFATHAVTDDTDPTKSFIAFYPDSSQFKLYTNELYDLSLQNARLVVLSACETGNGVLHKGEGVMSLARAFMYAGCPSVVTTLWNAHDESSAFLSERLHRYLQANMPIDMALQRAKLDYFDSTLGKEYDHPYFWANFTLIGLREPVDEQTSSIAWWIWALLAVVTLGVGIFYLRFWIDD